MKISARGWLVFGACAAIAAAVVMAGSKVASAQESAPAPLQAGQLTEDSLGNLVAAMGLDPKKVQKRYDFNFKALYKGEEWELSMSTVLSQNGKSLWVMAWLDPLPRSATDVPRTALLRLLAHNDRLGKGKFFAYIASNRRFVLQRVIPNQGLNTAAFRGVLNDLGISVIQTYPHWSVANWKASQPDTQTAEKDEKNADAPTRTVVRPTARTAVNDSKFATPTKRN